MLAEKPISWAICLLVAAYFLGAAAGQSDQTRQERERIPNPRLRSIPPESTGSQFDRYEAATERLKEKVLRREQALEQDRLRRREESLRIIREKLPELIELAREMQAELEKLSGEQASVKIYEACSRLEKLAREVKSAAMLK